MPEAEETARAEEVEELTEISVDELDDDQLREYIDTGEAPSIETAPEVDEPEEAAELLEPDPEPEVEEEVAEVTEPEETPAEEEVTEPPSEYESTLSQLQAKLDLQMAHNSRLAGKIGFLEKNLQRPSDAAEEYPDPQYENDRTVNLEARLGQLEREKAISEIQNGLTDGYRDVQSLHPDLNSLSEQLTEIKPKYEQELAMIQDSPDGATARQMVKAVLGAMVADAKALRDARLREEAGRMAADASEKLKVKKLDAAVSTSGGGLPPLAKKTRTPDDMTDKQLAAYIDKLGAS